jgi:hypothetical protein
MSDLYLISGGDVRKGITISTEDVYPLEGSRGEDNFIIKWPYANDQSYMKILANPKTIKSSYDADHSGDYVTILGLECRGIEPIAWYPSLDFVVRSSEDTVFNKVDLSERDWADYDEEHDLSVSVTNLEYKIESSA